MGYTHYWYTRKELPVEKWVAFKKDCEALLDADSAEGIVWSRKDKIFPYITDDLIVFNGIGQNGFESFSFSRNHGLKESNKPEFNCCKTRQKPYDKYVVDVLILAEKHFGDLIQVKSDGHWPDVKRDRELEKEREGVRMKLLEVKIPNSDDHIAIYYEGSISNVFLWEGGADTLLAAECETVTEEEVSE